MPSFQLFEINEEYSLKNLEKTDILETVKIKKNDPKTLESFLNSAKESYRNLRIQPTQKEYAVKIIMDEHTQFQDKQTLWINREKLIIKHKRFLLIGKAERKIEKILMIYLRDPADLKPVIFSDKYLWNIWKNMKKIQNENIKLHRVILKNTFIDADRIKELNIHANDINELSSVENIVKEAERIIVITVKVLGYYPKNKWLTIRIDRNGSFLVYGKHDIEIISKFMNLFTQSV